jgi:hypothetical protein
MLESVAPEVRVLVLGGALMIGSLGAGAVRLRSKSPRAI